MLGSLAADAPYAPDAVQTPAVTVSAGGCSAAPLPPDASCAAAARRFFRAAAAGVGLPEELLYDGAVMASELAANSLHARGAVEFAALPPGEAGRPEIWLYLRQVAGEQELVCAVFDWLPGWRGGRLPDLSAQAPLDAVSGRGLHVIDGLSRGRWGHHLSRPRLAAGQAPGKAVWFALPVPPAMGLDRFQLPQPGPLQAAAMLEGMLAGRGIDHIVRAQAPAFGMSVLSIRPDLTVWCRGRAVSWTTRSGSRELRPFCDLVDAAEQIVRAHEELAAAGTGTIPAW